MAAPEQGADAADRVALDEDEQEHVGPAAAAGPDPPGQAAQEEPAPEASPAAQAADDDDAPSPPSPPTNGVHVAGDQAAAAAPISARPAPAPAQAAAAAAQAEARARVLDIFTLARQQNFPGALKLLEAHPELWSAVDDEGHSFLHWGSLVGSKEFVASALSHGCPVNVQANNKQTPLMWAVLRGHIGAARLLLDAKADMQHHDSLGATPLMIAVQHRSYQSILLLMKRGKEGLLGDSDKNGCTAAHWAAYKGDLVTLKLLDYFGADLLTLDNAGMLPLHRATCASEVAVIEFLIEKRSDPLLRNKEGKTCLDIAEEQHAIHIQSLFKRVLKKGGGGSGKQVHDVEQGNSSEPEGEGKKKDGLFKSITKDKAAQKLFPVFWIVCVSLATFQYIMELRATSFDVAPVASRLFELGVPLSLSIFFWIAFSDPGKVAARTRGSTGVEELMRALDGGVPDGQEPDISRLCTTTWVLKDLRTKYCAQTGACVSEFDHYCVWLNNSIGRGNHRQFVGLALTEWSTQLVHIYLCWCMARSLVPYSGIGGWIFGLVTGYPLLVFIAVVQCLTAPWVMMLIVHQVRLVVMNLTTNEMMNMHRYEHFWVPAMVEPGRVQRMFRNPFHKGSAWKNCMDFWWTRRRSQMGPPSAGVAQSCCSHDHGSGGHGHDHGHSHGHSHGH